MTIEEAEAELARLQALNTRLEAMLAMMRGSLQHATSGAPDHIPDLSTPAPPSAPPHGEPKP